MFCGKNIKTGVCARGHTSSIAKLKWNKVHDCEQLLSHHPQWMKIPVLDISCAHACCACVGGVRERDHFHYSTFSLGLSALHIYFVLCVYVTAKACVYQTIQNEIDRNSARERERDREWEIERKEEKENKNRCAGRWDSMVVTQYLLRMNESQIHFSGPFLDVDNSNYIEPMSKSDFQSFEIRLEWNLKSLPQFAFPALYIAFWDCQLISEFHVFRPYWRVENMCDIRVCNGKHWYNSKCSLLCSPECFVDVSIILVSDGSRRNVRTTHAYAYHMNIRIEWKGKIIYFQQNEYLMIFICVSSERTTSHNILN